MSIKKAADFASKMNKERQHTFYQCCRIAADYYGVSATDVQKEMSSRSGRSANGRKYKYVVVYRIPTKLITINEYEKYEIEQMYFVKEPKATIYPQQVIRANEHIDSLSSEYNVHCEVFSNLVEAREFRSIKLNDLENKIVISTEEPIKVKQTPGDCTPETMLVDLLDFFGKDN